MLVRCRRKPRARLLGRYPSAATASPTASRILGVTEGLLLNTRETVPTDTPARFATSFIVAINACPTNCICLPANPERQENKALPAKIRSGFALDNA